MIKQLLADTKNKGKLNFNQILKLVKPQLKKRPYLNNIMVYNGVGFITDTYTVWYDFETYKDTEDCLISLETGIKTKFNKEEVCKTLKGLLDKYYIDNHPYTIDVRAGHLYNKKGTEDKTYIFRDTDEYGKLGNGLSESHIKAIQRTVYKNSLVLDFGSFLVSHPEPFMALTVINNHQVVISLLPNYFKKEEK